MAVFETKGKNCRSALNDCNIRVIVPEAVKVGGVQRIQHFLDLVLRHIVKAEQRAVQMNIAG
jgi:hypothetical protein